MYENLENTEQGRSRITAYGCLKRGTCEVTTIPTAIDEKVRSRRKLDSRTTAR